MMELNLVPVLPELFLALAAMGLLLVGAWRGNESTPVITAASVLAVLIALFIMVTMSWRTDITLAGMIRFDHFTGIMKIIIGVGVMASLALSSGYLKDEGMSRFEYPILILLAGIGMMLMVSANNLLALYMALELQSLSLYVLAAVRRNSTRSAEAGVKYFALGAISSGMILFGISLIYGYTGSLDYGVITAALIENGASNIALVFALVFLLAGIAFKISAVPFHMWTPDVYEGAPTSVTALFAMVPKVAAMGMLINLLIGPFRLAYDDWFQIIWFLSAASMIVGAFAAIAQDNIKRLLAYSSIGNMGYALIGVAAGTQEGIAAVVIYLLIYLVMTAGTFAVVLCMRRDGREVEQVSDLAGLSQTRPGLAYALAILMFSMSGIPPLAGFFGKLTIFQAAVQQEIYVLAILGVITSVVAAYYYLRIIKVMFFDEPAKAFDTGLPFARQLVLLVSIICVMGFIVKPGLVIEQSQAAASALFGG